MRICFDVVLREGEGRGEGKTNGGKEEEMGEEGGRDRVGYRKRGERRRKREEVGL